MLAEWYHDAGEAIARFKRRVGTAEAASFAETIEALRLREDDAFYALLRERIADYKAKIELGRESRKEAASYVLFVLAGVPILYMFQIFIYPWVQEGHNCFNRCNRNRNSDHCREGDAGMRNILMTVMLLIVVVVMFNTIIANPNGGTKG